MTLVQKSHRRDDADPPSLSPVILRHALHAAEIRYELHLRFTLASSVNCLPGATYPFHHRYDVLKRFAISNESTVRGIASVETPAPTRTTSPREFVPARSICRLLQYSTDDQSVTGE